MDAPALPNLALPVWEVLAADGASGPITAGPGPRRPAAMAICMSVPTGRWWNRVALTLCGMSGPSARRSTDLLKLDPASFSLRAPLEKVGKSMWRGPKYVPFGIAHFNQN